MRPIDRVRREIAIQTTFVSTPPIEEIILEKSEDKNTIEEKEINIVTPIANALSTSSEVPTVRKGFKKKS